MHRRVAFALALIVGLSGTSSAMAAKKKHKHKAKTVAYVVNSTVSAHSVASGGGTVTVAGVVADPLLGQGVTAYKITATGAINNSTFVEYNAKGSVSGTAVVTITPGPNNTSTVKGAGAITGGTLLYKKAKGSLQITGTIDANGFDHLVVTGTFKA